MREDEGKSIMGKSQPVSNGFSFRVLVVENAKTCLFIVGTMLKSCGYEVSTCEDAREALNRIQKDGGYDIVISSLHMPDMDGYKLLEEVKLLTPNLPIVMVLAYEDEEAISKVLKHGAFDYLLTPIKKHTIKFIWKYLCQREIKQNNLKHLSIEEIVEPQETILPSNVEEISSVKEREIKFLKGPISNDEVEEEASQKKKARLVWTDELRRMFNKAVDEIGEERAVPKKILEKMQSMGANYISRENVASHLQKYRHSKDKKKTYGQTSPETYDNPIMLDSQIMSSNYEMEQYNSSNWGRSHIMNETIENQSCDHILTPNEQLQDLNSTMSEGQLQAPDGTVALDGSVPPMISMHNFAMFNPIDANNVMFDSTPNNIVLEGSLLMANIAQSTILHPVEFQLPPEVFAGLSYEANPSLQQQHHVYGESTELTETK